MANYLYNGVELPDINEVWDKEKYPYAYLEYNEQFDAVSLYLCEHYVFYDGSSFLLYIRPSPYKRSSFYRSEDGLSILAELIGVTLEKIYATGVVVGEWCEEAVREGDNSLDASHITWTSHDILNTDGSVYLEASEPIPVAEKQYFLYNGVELPDINTVWTDELKAEHPHTVITSVDASVLGYSETGKIIYQLVLTDSSFYVSSETVYCRVPHKNEIYLVTFDNDVGSYCEGLGLSIFGSWSYLQSSDVSAGVNDSSLQGAAIWTNTDILNTDDTVYLAGSEPRVYNTKVFLDCTDLEGKVVVDMGGINAVKMSDDIPTTEQLEGGFLVFQGNGKYFAGPHANTIIGSEEFTYYQYESLDVFTVNAPCTVDGITIPETGIYAPVPLLCDFVALYYNSTSTDTEEPDMSTFDHKSFQIGIAVGLGLKGNYTNTIDTGINDAFTKGVEVGQRIRGKGGNNIDIEFVDGYLIIKNYPNVMQNGDMLTIEQEVTYA